MFIQNHSTQCFGLFRKLAVLRSVYTISQYAVFWIKLGSLQYIGVFIQNHSTQCFGLLFQKLAVLRSVYMKSQCAVFFFVISEACTPELQHVLFVQSISALLFGRTFHLRSLSSTW